ncbi:EcoKI restriction-modification system protein HsdS [Candidatus Rubidus massiliensis]|nr:EcoKI restriction-modification system protein HsdS [Candidatus Rubidus massiliensis]
MPPREWKYAKLEDVLTLIQYGTSLPSSDDGNVLVLGMKNLSEGSVTFIDCSKIKMKEQDIEKLKLINGDILLNRTNSSELVGKVGMFSGNSIVAVFASYLVRLRCNTKMIEPEFLNYWLNSSSIQRQLKGLATRGVSQSNINPTIAKKKIPVLLPSLSEQKAIAAFLSAWDEAIEKTERLISLKSKLILGVTQKIIGGQCKHWKHVKIADIFTCISEKKFSDEELLSVTQDQGVIPRSMLEGRVMSPQGSTEAYKLIVPGDFVVSLRSFQGGIEYSKYRGLISPAYTVLRPKTEINTEFYKKFFKTNLFIEKYLRISVIGIRDGKQISIPDLLITKIPLPSLQEQKKVALLLDNYTNEIDLLKELLNRYKTQKQGLMQKLLIGKWRVNFKEEKYNEWF